MKMSRLPSTTQQATPEAAERAALVQAGSVRRVEPMEGVVNERERSLQQDMAEVDPRAVGPLSGRRAKASAGGPACPTPGRHGFECHAVAALRHSRPASGQD